MGEQTIRRLRAEFPNVLYLSDLAFPLGWEDLVRDICVYLRDLTDTDVHVRRISLHHGKMRIDVDHAPLHVFKRIKEIQDESENVCETCGRIGTHQDLESGEYTLCPEDCERMGDDE